MVQPYNLGVCDTLAVLQCPLLLSARCLVWGKKNSGTVCLAIFGEERGMPYLALTVTMRPPEWADRAGAYWLWRDATPEEKRPELLANSS